MHVLLVLAHPQSESFCRGVRSAGGGAAARGGHSVDLSISMSRILTRACERASDEAT